MLYQPAIFSPFDFLAAAQSTRHGGVSEAPYHSLNLGKKTDDNPEAVLENRRRFCAALGFSSEQMAWSYQTHGDAVRHVNEGGGADGYDALISNRPGVLLAVSVADCTPILVYDAANRAIAAIHAGWRGTTLRIVEKTLSEMGRLFGTRGEDCYAFIGACIDECSFEVGSEVAEQFDTPFKRPGERAGKYYVDLKRANAVQLQNAGLPETRIEISPFCTVRHNADYFSHRKENGLTGRMLGVIGMRD